MLPHISNQAEYKAFLKRTEPLLSDEDRNDEKYCFEKEKMLLMESERAHDLFEGCYSQKVRPAHDPIIIFRSHILMLAFGYTSIDNWVGHLRKEKNLSLRLLIGVETKKDVPSVGAHYGFINRICNDDPHMDLLYPKGRNPRKKKHKKNNTGITKKLVKKYKANPKCDLDRWSRKLEELYNLVVVQPFLEKLLDKNLPLKEFILSGDGTCLHIASHPNGNRVKNPVDDQHTHRYTATTANSQYGLGFISADGIFRLQFVHI